MINLLAIPLTLLITPPPEGFVEPRSVKESPAAANIFLHVRPSAAGRDAWEGTYSFQETEGRTAGGSSTFVEHTIKIYRRGGEMIADIDAAGFQTSVSLRCTAKVEGDKIAFYFQSYREDNTFEPYRKGQLLLSFERVHAGSRTRMLTHWGAYRPTLKAGRSGKVYFRKAG